MTTNPRNAAHPRDHRDTDPDAAPVRPAKRRIAEGEKPDQLKQHAREAENRQEALIDEGVEETFPASDPVSPKRIT